jgi:NTP pyrophosphatase (non-canonical NTP hydrolase)
MPKIKQTNHNMTAEHELLQLLQEECAEVIQAASKCIRFGDKDNQFHLEKEIGDLFCILDIMHRFDMFSLTKAESYYEEKYEKLKKYTNLDLE